MKQNIFTLTTVCLLLIACKTEGKKVSDSLMEEKSSVDTIDLKLPIQKEIHLDNGIEIKWLDEGNGAQVQDGHVYNIDYRVRLEDSTIIDGVHLLRKPFIPYLVGFNMQPEGWDITMRNLKIGDFINARVPSRFLRGEHEAKGLVPKHADNFINIRVINEVKPTRIIDGVKVWVMVEAKAKTPVFGEDNEIEFFTMISTKTNPLYFNSFATGKPFRARLTDNGVIPGLKKALISAKKGDRLLILVPSSQAYGNKGLQDLVKPNEDIFFNLYVNDVIE